MDEAKLRTMGRDAGERDPGGDATVSPERGWDRLQSAVDEAEVESFPASDPQSSWAGPDRDNLPRRGDAQKQRAS